jgi:hypothetical protein
MSQIDLHLVGVIRIPLVKSLIVDGTSEVVGFPQ